MEKLCLNGQDWTMKEFVGMDWVWRNSIGMDTADTRWWNKATVPGSVLNDLISDGLVPDPYFELNSKLVEWVPARTWVYRKKFNVPSGWEGKKIWLFFEGIDYEGEIFLNGVSLGNHKGMFLPWKKEISENIFYQKENLLAVVIEPAPHEQPQVGKTSQVTTHKSRMTYWWDFCPRMIHQGIWDDVYLKATLDPVIEEVEINYHFDSSYSKAEVEINVETTGRKRGKVCVSFGNERKEAFVENGQSKVRFTILYPELWWPNGYGKQYQYPLLVELYDGEGKKSDCYYKKIGIRNITFGANENAPLDAPSLLLYVNGRKIYMNGYNWVPIDVMYGVNRKEKLEHLIRLAKKAHVNIFRVWGGGLIEKDSFYERCAEAGILVWQEFILSSSGIDNATPRNDAYYNMMSEQAEIIIKRKRNHTALAVWCGGNELQDYQGNPLDDQDVFLAMLKEKVQRLDPTRKWLPTSPSGGVFMNSVDNIKNHPDKLYDVHGPWEHQGIDNHCKLYNMGTSLLHTEFGVEGMTNCNVLYRTTSKEHLMPASKDNEVYFHRGTWWNNEPLVQETFGWNLTDIQHICKASQFLQYEGLKYAVESNRRRAFRNSGSFPWQFNEPYPNHFCTSHIDYYGEPKPVYYGIKKAYKPVTVTASFDSPSLVNKEKIDLEIYLGTQYTEAEIIELEKIEISVQMVAEDGTIFYKEKVSKPPIFNGTKKVMDIQFEVNKIPSKIFLLRLLAFSKGSLIANNEYIFTKEKDFKNIYLMEKPQIGVSIRGNSLCVRNNGNITGFFIYIRKKDNILKDRYVYFDENYFCLLPGEEKNVCIYNENILLEDLQIEALNI